MKKNNINNKLTFELAMKELESLVDKIDNDEISLNEIVETFERGTFLMSYCNKELTKVEDKIYRLTKTKSNIKIDS